MGLNEINFTLPRPTSNQNRPHHQLIQTFYPTQHSPTRPRPDPTGLNQINFTLPRPTSN